MKKATMKILGSGDAYVGDLPEICECPGQLSTMSALTGTSG